MTERVEPPTELPLFRYRHPGGQGLSGCLAHWASAGKTTLRRRLFPSASYPLLEDLDVVAAARADPRSFLAALKLPAIVEETQIVPELLNYIRARVSIG